MGDVPIRVKLYNTTGGVCALFNALYAVWDAPCHERLNGGEWRAFPGARAPRCVIQHGDLCCSFGEVWGQWCRFTLKNSRRVQFNHQLLTLDTQIRSLYRVWASLWSIGCKISQKNQQQSLIGVNCFFPFWQIDKRPRKVIEAKEISVVLVRTELHVKHPLQNRFVKLETFSHQLFPDVLVSFTCTYKYSYE